MYVIKGTCFKQDPFLEVCGMCSRDLRVDKDIYGRKVHEKWDIMLFNCYFCKYLDAKSVALHGNRVNSREALF